MAAPEIKDIMKQLSNLRHFPKHPDDRLIENNPWVRFRKGLRMVLDLSCVKFVASTSNLPCDYSTLSLNIHLLFEFNKVSIIFDYILMKKSLQAETADTQNMH